MSDITALLNQFAARYRTALLTKVGLLLALSFGVIAVLAWRLRVLRMPVVWSVGAPAVLAAVAGATAWWWIHRRWISAHDAAAHLDRVLRLEERLTTADEFAKTEHAPALYPLLVEDVGRSFSSQQAQVPKPFNRTTAVLAAVLLLLLLLPLGGKAPIQLTRLMPHPAPPPPAPPHTPPPQSSAQQHHQQQQQSSSASPSQSSSGGQGGEGQSSSGNAPSQPQGGGDQSQQHGGQSDQSSPGREGGASQPQTPGNTSTQQQPQAGAGQPQQRAGQSGQSQPGQAGKSAESASDGNSAPSQDAPRENRQGTSSGQSAQQRAAQQTAAQGGMAQQPQPAGGSGRQSGSRQGQQQPAQTQRASSASSGSSSGASNMSGASAKTQGAAQQSPGAATSQQQPGSGSPGASGSAGAQQAPSGVGTSLGSQEAIKGDIQGLLKELSGELKDLEAQLASTKSEAHPQAGTTTDPQLYGSSDPMSPRGTAPVPIQLKTDTAPTASKRASNGVALPSGQVSTSGPQVKGEDAALSEEPAEENAVTRQVVPPEYRSVFDKLHQQSSQPSETKR